MILAEQPAAYTARKLGEQPLFKLRFNCSPTW